MAMADGTAATRFAAQSKSFERFSYPRTGRNRPPPSFRCPANCELSPFRLLRGGGSLQTNRSPANGKPCKTPAWEISVLTDPRLNETDRRVALAVAEADRRGFVLCEKDGDYFFEPNDQYVAAKMAA
jgi:hypothetical protein